MLLGERSTWTSFLTALHEELSIAVIAINSTGYGSSHDVRYTSGQVLEDIASA